MGAAVAVAAAGCFIYFVLLVVALGQLTGERRAVAVRYIAIAFVAAWVLIDWLSGATGWVMVEGTVLIVAISVGVVHLTALLMRESRDS
jgi:hypothetical protein